MRLAASTALALLALAAPAQAEKQVAEANGVRAEATFKDTANGPKDVVLRVLEDGVQIVRRAIGDERFLTPIEVAVRDLEGDAEPEAVFTLFTGGAHCCVLTFIYEGTQLLEHDFGNAGYVFEKIDGELSFVTSDDRFSYRYASYAGSLRPLLVQRYEGALVDVTRDPALRPRIKREAKRFKSFYQRAHRNNAELREAYASPLAAFTADQCNLGSCARGYALVDKAVGRDEVAANFGERIRRDMVKLGYDAAR